MPNPDTLAVIGSLSDRFRQQRMARFAREFGVTEKTRILDIGGTPECWRLLAVRPHVVLLNMPHGFGETCGSEVRVAGDGRALPFRDGAFDIVFSNSVIEHVGDRASQERFAREASRVGRAYWIQTPDRWFPVEQHLMTPLLHWLPKRWQRAIAPRFNFWNALARVTPDRRSYYIRHFLEDIRLLGPAELRSLFPGARVIRQRFCGLTKSLVAAGFSPGSAPRNPSSPRSRTL